MTLGFFFGMPITLSKQFWNLLLDEPYSADRMLRSAMERQFEIIGEALNQLCKLDPNWMERIPDLAQIVAFRNLLIHGYASVNDLTVWNTIEMSLPTLYKTLARLLNE